MKTNKKVNYCKDAYADALKRAILKIEAYKVDCFNEDTKSKQE